MADQDEVCPSALPVFHCDFDTAQPRPGVCCGWMAHHATEQVLVVMDNSQAHQRQWNSCNAQPHCLGAVGSATPAMHCLTAWGQWAVVLLQCTAALPGGSGQCNSCNALPHCLGAVGSGTPAMHCLTARGQGAVQLLQCTAPLPGGGGQWYSCNAPPHCLGAVGSGTPAMHCLTAWGQWTVVLLHCHTEGIYRVSTRSVLKNTNFSFFFCSGQPFSPRTMGTYRLAMGTYRLAIGTYWGGGDGMSTYSHIFAHVS